jgi:hypothetical protein
MQTRQAIMTQLPSHARNHSLQRVTFDHLDALAASLEGRRPDPGFVLETMGLLARHRTASDWQDWREFATGHQASAYTLSRPVFSLFFTGGSSFLPIPPISLLEG